MIILTFLKTLLLIILLLFGLLMMAYFIMKVFFYSVQINELMLGLFSLNISMYFLFFQNSNILIIDLLFKILLFLTSVYFVFYVIIIIIETIKNHEDNELINKK